MAEIVAGNRGLSGISLELVRGGQSAAQELEKRAFQRLYLPSRPTLRFAEVFYCGLTRLRSCASLSETVGFPLGQP